MARANIEILQTLQRICNVPDRLRSDLPIKREEAIVASSLGPEHIYLVYDNVGCAPRVEGVVIRTTKIDPSVPVLPRGSFVDRVADLEARDELCVDHIRASLQHLYFRYLMNVGDSGPHNILVPSRAAIERVVVGIDMEEVRSGRTTKQTV